MCTFHPGLETTSGFKCYGLDPKEVAILPGFRVLPDETLKKYKRTWLQFVQEYKIAVERPPTESDLYNFLNSKFSRGLKSSTVRSNYSHINLACQELYKEKIDKYPSLYRLINFEKKRGPPVKKAKTLEQEEFEKFFSLVKLDDCYQLVRAAAAICLYFGCNRVKEIKDLKFGGKN